MRREIKCLRRMGKKGEEGRWGAKCKIDQTKSPSWIPVTNGPSLPIKEGPKAAQCPESGEVRSVQKLDNNAMQYILKLYFTSL